MSELAIVDILSSDIAANNSVTLQLGDSVTKSVTSEGAEIWSMPGFFSRPSKATPGVGSCQALALEQGDRSIVFATRDTRSSDITGNLGEGDVAMAATGPEGTSQGRFIIKGDGSCTQFTREGNTSSGAGCYEKLDPTQWCVHMPFGSIVFDKTGLHVIHNSGFTLHGGGIANPVQPNYFRVSAAQVLLSSPQILLGPPATNGGSGVYMAAVVAPVPSPQTGVPVPIGAGLGVTLGETAKGVFCSV